MKSTGKLFGIIALAAVMVFVSILTGCASAPAPTPYGGPDAEAAAKAERAARIEAYDAAIAAASAERAAQAEAQRLAREEAERKALENFILVPTNTFFPFKPADYDKADLFAAVAASERLAANEYAFGRIFHPSRDFVSDVVFVSQNGTDITFRTEDNAISKRMKVESRTGLSAGQKVRIYYRAYRYEDWEVKAIERR